MSAEGTEGLKLGKNPSGLSEPTNDEAEVNAAWKTRQRKELRLRNHGDVKINDAEQLDQDCRAGVKVVGANLEFGDKSNVMISGHQ